MLWFDALWNCLSVLRRSCGKAVVVIWCSLKLSFSQWPQGTVTCFVVIWCSLKLSFSSHHRASGRQCVVIWCSLKLSFSMPSCHHAIMRLWFDALWNCLSVSVGQYSSSRVLWFDALWNCLSVTVVDENMLDRCDLMLFEIVFQWRIWPVVTDGVVIWCSLKLSFSWWVDGGWR